MENSLEALFAQRDYATDKLSAHSYVPVYERLFGKRRDRVANVLEIGIGSGGSLVLWNDYFKHAQIYGIDPNYIHDYLDRFERVHQIRADAYSDECIQSNFISQQKTFDVIIDDGPHNRRSQMAAMELYFPLLTEDGVIIIEDVQDHLDPGAWIRDIVGSLPVQYREFAQVIDLRHLNKSPDDLLIVLDKSGVDSAALPAPAIVPFPSCT